METFSRVAAQRATGLIMWRTILVCVLTMLAPAVAAQVFECLDAKGVKQYAQFCPPGTVQQRQVGKSGEGGAEAGAGAVAPKSIEAQDVEFKKRMFERQAAEAKAAQEKAQAEESERNCLDARTQLQYVLDGRRMSRVDPETGEQIQYGDEDRTAEAERQRKAVEQWCK
jgi:hypothetical protein